ncbi:heme o synthase [Acidipila rosea]|uniref:Protoheme IX farnesyltransferase n=1 Tax=Acidipila rosea TaxID=768535 RepID=A0A4R1L7X2_9BACT|nr:heme o synthase [Acidipila rosea]TCK74335.1 protoheme IX farnesyltransferase [Acidipila rosea]
MKTPSLMPRKALSILGSSPAGDACYHEKSEPFLQIWGFPGGRLYRAGEGLRVTPATVESRSAVAAAHPQPASETASPTGAGSEHLRAGETASRIADYRELFKIRVTTMVVMTAWAGFYLGSMRSGISSVQPELLTALLGIGLVSAGSAALNECLERKLDARMLRTAQRPMATGRIGLAHGIILGLAAIIGGTLWLTHSTNLVTGTLTLITAFTYVAVYTPLKRRTTLATFIGAFPGAMPPLLGWTAARGLIEWPAVALFAILFVWQFPHFMAISWLYREDYGRAGIRMLPVVQPDGWSTVLEALTYAVLMIPVSLLPVYLHIAGHIYGAVAIVLGLMYLGYTIRFARITRARSAVESKMYARDLLKVSVVYLPVLLTVLMLNAAGK